MASPLNVTTGLGEPGPPLPSLPPLTNTFGAVLISSFLAIGLYGVTINQTFQYFRSFPSDLFILKVIAAAIFMADTFHSVTLMHLCYHYLVSNYFAPLNLLFGEWSIQVMSASTGVVVLLAQTFYARRIYLVNPRYKWVVVFIATLILVELGFMITATYRALTSVTFMDFAPYLWLDSVLFCLATATDLILLIVFIIFLRTSRTSFRGTQVALDSLALYAVIGTLLNTALTLPAFISSMAAKETFIYMAMAIPTTKIYSNSVLGFLNCRSSLVEAMSSAPSSFKLSSMLKRIGRGTPESQSERGRRTDPHQRGLGSSGSGMAIDIETPKFEELANLGGIDPAVAIVQHTFGAFLLALFFALPLYGIAVSQAYRYFITYRTDKLFVKVLVVAIIIADTLHSAQFAHICYYYIVISYANLPAMQSTGYALVSSYPFFEAQQLTVPPVSAATVGGFYPGIGHNFSASKWFEAVQLAVAALGDLILTITLLSTLQKDRMRISGRTDAILDTLTLYIAIATGLSGAFTILLLVITNVSQTASSTTLFVALSIPGTKVVTNLVLFFLNCRNVITERADHRQGAFNLNFSIFDRANGPSTAHGNPDQMVCTVTDRIALGVPTATGDSLDTPTSGAASLHLDVEDVAKKAESVHLYINSKRSVTHLSVPRSNFYTIIDSSTHLFSMSTSTPSGNAPSLLPKSLVGTQSPESPTTIRLDRYFVPVRLYGMTLHQSYRYFRMFPHDKFWLKGVVYATMIGTHPLPSYYYLVTSYLKPTALLFGTWTIKLLLIFSGGIIIVSQSFFAWRVFLFGPRYRLLVFVAMSLLVGELAFFAAATIETFIIPTFRGFERFTWLISTGSAMAVVADLLLTSVLITNLRTSRTGIKRTDSIIDLLILYSISTGLLTSIFNILSFLFTVLYHDNLIYVAFAVIVTKLYANTLLVALNTRSTLSTSGGPVLVEASDAGIYGSTVVIGNSIALPRMPQQNAHMTPSGPVLDIKAVTTKVTEMSISDHWDDRRV
ncbi:hypothetical protein C8Q74DRAFT_1366971 [Fomes fomentarius]|nr:hypothetical protein C8Q74DRAFT_1366971 [Fomes fomentarius]